MSQLFSGYFFKLSSAPYISKSDGKALFLRDKLVQLKIDEFMKDGIPIVLINQGRGVKGFVLRNDLEWKKTFISVLGNQKNEFLFGLSSDASYGTLMHEHRHVQQENPGDPIAKIKKMIRAISLPEDQIAKLIRFIVEFDAYEVQIKKLKRLATENPNQMVWRAEIISRMVEGQRVTRTEYENQTISKYYENNLPEVERSIRWHSHGAQKLLNQLKIENSETYCKILEIMNTSQSMRKAVKYLQLEYSKCQ
jgi:hypothetical protein